MDLCFVERASYYIVRPWPTWYTLALFTICLLYSSTCFEHYILIIKRLKFIEAASGIVTLNQWPPNTQVERAYPPHVSSIISSKHVEDILSHPV
jgi:hypothetical protein